MQLSLFADVLAETLLFIMQVEGKMLYKEFRKVLGMFEIPFLFSRQ